jgi:hypothetical protein
MKKKNHLKQPTIGGKNKKTIIRDTPLEAKKTFTLVTPAGCEKTFQSHWRQNKKKSLKLSHCRQKNIHLNDPHRL